MKRIGLVFALSFAVGLALPPGAAWADGFPGTARGMVGAGHADTSFGRRVVPTHRVQAFGHRVVRHGVVRPFANPHAVLGVPVVEADPATYPPTVIINNTVAGDTALPPGAANPESVPPPVQPKMITLNPGKTRDWCWDKSTWSWVATCP